MLVSLPLASIFLPRIVKSDRVKIFVVTSVVVTLLLRFYFACDLFHCYALEDPLQPVRLGLLMVGLIVFGDSFGVWRGRLSGDVLKYGGRKYLLAFSTIYTLSYYPLSFVFAGVAGYPEWSLLRLVYSFIVAPIITGLITLELIQNRLRAFITYFASGILTLLSFSTLPCTGCESNVSLFSGGPLVAGVCGTLGVIVISRIAENVSRVNSLHVVYFCHFGVVLLTFSLPATIAVSFQGATPATPSITVGSVGLSTNGVYAGVYAAIPYTSSCCVMATIIFPDLDPATAWPNNYLKSGIGVQAPNRYIDGIDYGYRLDAYILSRREAIVTANAWETCDLNLACGGVPWQTHLYGTSYVIDYKPGSLSLNLSIRMNSTTRMVVWFENNTEIGSFNLPDIALPSFGVGVIPLSSTTWLNYPYEEAFFLQFGIESRYPIQNNNWSVKILNPSYMKNGTWTTIGHAAVIGGDTSFWKTMWVWGGRHYDGVNIVKVPSELGFMFNYGGSTTPDNSRLW